MARHRTQYQILRYPIKSHIRYWQNRWYLFMKPALKRAIRKITVR